MLETYEALPSSNGHQALTINRDYFPSKTKDFHLGDEERASTRKDPFARMQPLHVPSSWKQWSSTK